MSKSLGNMAFVHDLLERHTPAALRTHLLRRHFREDWEFNESDLEQESEDEVSLEARDGEATFDPVTGREEFFTALDTDLDAPAALRVLDRAAGSSEPAAKELLHEGRAILGLLDL